MQFIQKSDKDWLNAYTHVGKILQQYVALVGQPGPYAGEKVVFCHVMLMKYELGERSDYLFQEMEACS